MARRGNYGAEKRQKELKKKKKREKKLERKHLKKLENGGTEPEVATAEKADDASKPREGDSR
jgi:hypothetical protein